MLKTIWGELLNVLSLYTHFKSPRKVLKVQKMQYRELGASFRSHPNESLLPSAELIFITRHRRLVFFFFSFFFFWKAHTTFTPHNSHSVQVAYLLTWRNIKSACQQHLRHILILVQWTYFDWVKVGITSVKYFSLKFPEALQ